MLILAIETSCDETGIALVEASGSSTSSGQWASLPRFRVLKNLISSQITVHRPFGGVVPTLAKREHQKNLPVLLKRIMNYDLRFKKKFINHKSIFVNPYIDLIAVTVGPGLEPALWTGITFTKELAKKYKKPLIGTNHLQGHLYSFLLSKSYSNVLKNIRIRNLFPAVALIVSGGHTILLKMDSLTKWKKLGETRDDAAGEAFDKVARMLNLPYPGGPEIERIAKKGNPAAITFPRPMIHTKDYDFSFSGLKTAVLYHMRGQNSQTNADSPAQILGQNLGGQARTNAEKSRRKSASSQRKSADAADVAASFQQAVIDVLVSKTIRAAKEYGTRSIILCGGVAANKALRQKLKTESSKLKANFLVPHFSYNTDNAAMIAAAGYFAYLKKKKLPLTANGDLGI